MYVYSIFSIPSINFRVGSVTPSIMTPFPLFVFVYLEKEVLQQLGVGCWVPLRRAFKGMLFFSTPKRIQFDFFVHEPPPESR